MRISIDECKERTARIRAKREWLEKVCSRDNIDEDLKVIDVTPIESLFSKTNLGKFRQAWPSRRLLLSVHKSGYKIPMFYTPTISLLQSMINSPNAYEQNKAFTKHIVEAMMKAHEEKL